ncbi:pyridoxamine 5'-phosphate oxidase family protein [Rubellimicrobium sp. CFH 75288]|uniref:pyridoxamine 5'-phosphate oxidase family protein n=1 Tax=Rubellimicrobium sp. CFH 75288 TaxID=2697034 RepID=UPI0014129E30|nr:pyridoxamine 5'-phosphate oxidase family protein [Rubellimicrobium sp. CFH 75288]NAZ37112.1 pyridoxamine 5'-phosphate oxidase family protein [Rubellimicrobium sp. CFH 75288]
MTDDAETRADLEARFWKALRSDMTVMLGLDKETEQRPMTAQLASDEDRGPIWFFSAKDHDLNRRLEGATPATFTFVSKGHDLWATVSGTLVEDMNRAMIDKLWNPHVAAWYPGGKEDPSLSLLRFDPASAKIWKDGSSLMAGLLSLLGRDPQADYQDNTATVNLR